MQQLESASMRESYATSRRHLRKRRGVLTLSKSVRLRSAELGASTLDLGKAALTSVFVFGGVHLDVGAEAVGGVGFEEGAVPAVENVDFGVGEAGVVLEVDGAVVLADVFGP